MDVIKTAEELQTLLDTAIAEKENLQRQLITALEANYALTAEVEMLSNAAQGLVKKAEEKIVNLAEHVFEYAGKIFGFNYPKLTRKGGQVITPVEVKASPDLQKELVESGSSMIYEKKS